MIFVESMMDPHDALAPVTTSSNKGADLDYGPRGPQHRENLQLRPAAYGHAERDAEKPAAARRACRRHRPSDRGVDRATTPRSVPEDTAPRYLVHDRDHTFAAVAATAGCMGIQEVRTAARSPWQNAYAERLIGSIRRECLDHVIVVNETGLSRILTRYLAYYHLSRTHLSLAKDSPHPRPVAPRTRGPIVAIPLVGGLHYRYDRRAA
jgi:hypothetical protein